MKDDITRSNVVSATPILDYKTALVIGTRPSHVHACGCECNSAYCEEVTHIPCQNHGGPPRIQGGYEPWRGR